MLTCDLCCFVMLSGEHRLYQIARVLLGARQNSLQAVVGARGRVDGAGVRWSLWTDIVQLPIAACAVAIRIVCSCPSAACAVALKIVYSCQLQHVTLRHVPLPVGLCAIVHCSMCGCLDDSVQLPVAACAVTFWILGRTCTRIKAKFDSRRLCISDH